MNIKNKLIVNEKLKHENKITKDVRYNCEPLYKYVKPKTKNHKNSTVKKKIYKKDELTNTPIEIGELKQQSFQFVHSLVL